MQIKEYDIGYILQPSAKRIYHRLFRGPIDLTLISTKFNIANDSYLKTIWNLSVKFELKVFARNLVEDVKCTCNVDYNACKYSGNR